MIHWEDLRFLLAAHRGGSLAGAARALGVDATTVGRRLGAAERALGARVFTRTPDGLRPTAAGLAVLAAAASMEHAVEAAERAAAGTDGRVEGSVRVTSGEGVLTALLAPALPALR
ncbi:MAG TPA: LysR family transcriptional regulator, partial [Anaeromyxobacteraceae bacterium]|nr:LysR family transcriptional regulator [Anaeromyxobacteraceae bacterium]